MQMQTLLTRDQTHVAFCHHAHTDRHVSQVAQGAMQHKAVIMWRHHTKYTGTGSDTVMMLLQAVQCLHLQGRAHSDIKPDNIRVVLDTDGQVLQCTLHDLGGSVMYQGESLGTSTSRTFATRHVRSSGILDRLPRMILES